MSDHADTRERCLCKCVWTMVFEFSCSEPDTVVEWAIGVGCSCIASWPPDLHTSVGESCWRPRKACWLSDPIGDLRTMNTQVGTSKASAHEAKAMMNVNTAGEATYDISASCCPVPHKCCQSPHRGESCGRVNALRCGNHLLRLCHRLT